ncbi:putative HTH-type transcriptional regulator YusO [Paenibacillus auburnensis]|uniref:HTH-type transcriptional regulator YusO n=1 Tax=Paenibacillus auburnensis TaxID=2905649 RepID=A0ABN8G3K6_9BACL|nr:MarR family transcriptional regulator [Paenibacillus auburnensis]CAH1194948.1 putative HTH-type transcriptional regulator YusO [Paenibacillus auburnensis]
MTERDDYFEISLLFKTFLKGVAQEWNKQGFRLSQTQFKALYVLSKEGPMMVSQLAAALDLTPAAVTGITDQLLADAYIQKERAEGDRRAVKITLTAEGKSIIKEVKDKQKEVMHSYFSILPEEDMDHLRRIFAVLIKEIDKN